MFGRGLSLFAIQTNKKKSECSGRFSSRKNPKDSDPKEVNMFILQKTMVQVLKVMGCKVHFIVLGKYWFDQSQVEKQFCIHHYVRLRFDKRFA